MNKTLRRLIAILMAVALAFAMSASVLAEEEEEEKEEEEQSSSATWTNTITNPEDGSQNVIQNVNVNVEVEVENKGGSDGGSADAGTGAVQNPETLLKYCEITGSAITSHDWVYLYAEASIHSKILETLKTREEPVEIIGRAENSKHQIWYKVKTQSGKIGYCSSTYLNVTSSGGGYVRDLNNVNKNALIRELLSYHHAGGNCYYGLLYRRADELEMFLYGDYAVDGRSNKYRFPNPSCISFP